jgi:hypothetical protein
VQESAEYISEKSVCLVDDSRAELPVCPFAGQPSDIKSNAAEWDDKIVARTLNQ